MRRPLSTALLLLLLPAAALAQWSWLYPQPQGHTLNDVTFLDNQVAIAVGEAGTVLVTHDAGDSWAVQSMVLGTTATLRHVERVDGTTAVAVGDGGTILRTNDSGATWTPIASGVTGDLPDVSFADALHGVAISNQVALRTNDGGFSWQGTSLPQSASSVDMVSFTEVFAVASSFLLWSIDGGETWSASALPNGGNITIEFMDNMRGLVAGPYQAFVTVNGGASWQDTPIYAGLSEYDPAEFVYGDADHVFAALTYFPDEAPARGILEMTVDHGGAWTTPAGSYSDLGFNGLDRNQDGVTLVVGDDGRIKKMAADGTFTQIGGPLQTIYPSSLANDMSFADPQHGVVMKSARDPWFGGFQTSICRTTDGGATWATSSAGEDIGFFAIAHASANELYGVGARFYNDAVVRHSVDGGATWAPLWLGSGSDPGTPNPPGLKGIGMGSGTHGLAVGLVGVVVVIDGNAAVPVATGINKAYADVAFSSVLNAVSVGAGGAIARTLDGGQTWAPVAGGTTNDLLAVDFATGTVGYAAGSNIVLRTYNAGASWAPVPNPPTGVLADVDFADADHGIVVGRTASYRGVGFATDDGGDTWTPFGPPTLKRLTDVVMFSQTHAYVGGTEQSLFEYGSNLVPTLFSSFEAAPKAFAAELRWTVQDEADLAGFRVMRRSGSRSDAVAVSSVSAATRAYTDDTVRPGASYEYTLVAVEKTGEEIPSVPARVSIPAAELELLPNQPNPFNPSTTIRFVVPERMRVTLTVHDVAGRLVATLIDEVRDPGLHSVAWDGSGAASGVYFSRLSAGHAQVSRKMVLLK